MTKEERLALDRRYEELINNPRFVKQPVSVVTVPVSDSFAVKAKAKPENVRVTVTDTEGVTFIERPKPNPNHVKVLVNCVREVDGYGRPVWDK